MSEVENEIEVEVDDVVSPQENIQQMRDKMADGDVTGAEDAFNAIMGDKADSLVAARKGEVTNTMFNGPDATEMQKMGLAPAPDESDSND